MNYEEAIQRAYINREKMHAVVMLGIQQGLFTIHEAGGGTISKRWSFVDVVDSEGLHFIITPDRKDTIACYVSGMKDDSGVSTYPCEIECRVLEIQSKALATRPANKILEHFQQTIFKNDAVLALARGVKMLHQQKLIDRNTNPM